MIGTLLRQDPAYWAIPKVIAATAGLAVVSRAAPDINAGLQEFIAGGRPGGVIPIAALFTALGVLTVLAANSWSRCSRLHLALPLAPRRLWTVRVTAIMIAAAAPIAVATLILGVRVDGGAVPIRLEPMILALAARVLAAVALAVVLLQLPDPKVYRVPATPQYVVHCVVACGLSIVVTVVAFPSPLLTLVVAAIAAALGLAVWRALPSAFSLPSAPVAAVAGSEPAHSDQPARPRAATETAAAAAEPPTLPRWIVSRTVFRELTNNVLSWLMMAYTFGVAVLCVREYADGGNVALPLVIIAILMVPQVQFAAARIDRLDPLPVSRRLMFAYIAVPMLLSILAGAALGRALVARAPERLAQVRFVGCCVKVPHEYMEVTRSGSAPAVRAPWGETHTPDARPVLRGGSVALYNPYETGPSSSVRFVDWQLRRAVEAVHGIPVPQHVLAGDGQPGASFVGGVERGSFTPDYARGQPSERRSRTAAVALLMITAVATVLVSLSLAQYLPTERSALYKWAGRGALAVIVGIVTGVFALALAGLTREWYASALVAIAARRVADWAPLPTAALWALAWASWAGAYLAIRSIFMRIEAPGRAILKPFAQDY
jgi:hypothetical protein